MNSPLAHLSLPTPDEPEDVVLERIAWNPDICGFMTNGPVSGLDFLTQVQRGYTSTDSPVESIQDILNDFS